MTVQSMASIFQKIWSWRHPSLSCTWTRRFGLNQQSSIQRGKIFEQSECLVYEPHTHAYACVRAWVHHDCTHVRTRICTHACVTCACTHPCTHTHTHTYNRFTDNFYIAQQSWNQWLWFNVMTVMKRIFNYSKHVLCFTDTILHLKIIFKCQIVSVKHNTCRLYHWHNKLS